jgi:hypothetical protein
MFKTKIFRLGTQQGVEYYQATLLCPDSPIAESILLAMKLPLHAPYSVLLTQLSTQITHIHPGSWRQFHVMGLHDQLVTDWESIHDCD